MVLTHLQRRTPAEPSPRAQVHTAEELRRVLELPEELLDPSAVLLGINNRDLQTFEVSLDNTAAIMGSDAGREVRPQP